MHSDCNWIYDTCTNFDAESLSANNFHFHGYRIIFDNSNAGVT